ncbi:MAG: 50S ribosomal protein L9 [Planctomycetota bacterium]|jgi:large subunit ribosomal protein L9
MAKNVELLLLKTVENLGIVGDVVRVKAGYARNYLCPGGLAEPPSPARIEALKVERAKAEAELAALRATQERLVERLTEVSVGIERSCNDQGALYGSVTQRDISDALNEAGYGVDVKSLRLSHPIRRVGTYPVPIQFDKDLRAEVTLTVKPDRELEGFGAEGEPADEAAAAEEAEAPIQDKSRDTRRKGSGKRDAETAQPPA